MNEAILKRQTLDDDQVMQLVREELARARERYPWWPRDLVYAATIANEENGEVIKAVNNYFWRHGDDTLPDVRKEAVQAIAMWIRFLTETPDIDQDTMVRNVLIQTPRRGSTDPL